MVTLPKANSLALTVISAQVGFPGAARSTITVRVSTRRLLWRATRLHITIVGSCFIVRYSRAITAADDVTYNILNGKYDKPRT